MPINENTARQVHELLMQASAAIDGSVAAVQDSGISGRELTDYKRAAGKVLGEMWFELLKPLYDEHPTLIPPELKDVKRPGESN